MLLRNVVCGGMLLLLSLLICGVCSGVTQSTQEITVISGLAGSTEDPEETPTGFDSQSTRGTIYLGSWGTVHEGIGWTKYDIPDFSGTGQRIVKVQLNLGAVSYNVGHPWPGIIITRVEDDSWTESTIHTEWPVSEDSIVERPSEPDPQWTADRQSTDITEWFISGAESLTGGEPLSIRYTKTPPYDVQASKNARFGYPTVTITSVPVGVARFPIPDNNEQGISPEVTLAWSPGEGAVSHNVYFGTDPTPDMGEFKGNYEQASYQPAASLDFNTTYYWRIDEVLGDTSEVEGVVWSFTVRPPIYKAWNPYPLDDGDILELDDSLNWTPGDFAVYHDVYFGEDFDEVQNAVRLEGDINGDGQVNLGDLSILSEQWLGDSSSQIGVSANVDGQGTVNMSDFAAVADNWWGRQSPIYKGRYSSDTNSLNVGEIKFGQTYYWRIDEVNQAHPQKSWKGDVWTFSATLGLDRGHKLLLKYGLQIQAIIFMDYGFDLNRWAQSNFTSVNLWDRNVDMSNLGDPPGIPWGRIGNYNYVRSNEEPYASNFISVQHGDEQEGYNENWIQDAKTALATLRSNIPQAISYTNQRMDAPDRQGYDIMREYMEEAEPDMLSLGIYIFRCDAWDRDYDDMYRRLQFYRILALEGHDGTGQRPIPQSYIPQLWWDNTSGCTVPSHPFEIPSDSELRSQLFAAWTMGLKYVNYFVYNDPYYPSFIHPALFEGDGDANPRPQFYYQAETNRQSLNLGPAIVRLVSTDLRMIEADQPRPGNIQPWTPDADPYITSISATNLGTVNNGQPGHLLIGYFKPLHEALDGPQYQDQIYFMIYNGLTGADALVSETRQQIDIGFSFGDSGIDSLQRRSRDTGQVELVPLQHMEGSVYKLELVLPGGTADLFKFNTGAPFIGNDNP